MTGAQKWPPVALGNTPVAAPLRHGSSSVKPPRDLLQVESNRADKTGFCFTQLLEFYRVQCWSSSRFWWEEHMEPFGFFKMDFAHVNVLTITVVSLSLSLLAV